MRAAVHFDCIFHDSGDDPKITMFGRTWRLIDNVDGYSDDYERIDRDVPVNSIDAT